MEENKESEIQSSLLSAGHDKKGGVSHKTSRPSHEWCMFVVSQIIIILLFWRGSCQTNHIHREAISNSQEEFLKQSRLLESTERYKESISTLNDFLYSMRIIISEIRKWKDEYSRPLESDIEPKRVSLEQEFIRIHQDVVKATGLFNSAYLKLLLITNDDSVTCDVKLVLAQMQEMIDLTHPANGFEHWFSEVFTDDIGAMSPVRKLDQARLLIASSRGKNSKVKENIVLVCAIDIYLSNILNKWQEHEHIISIFAFKMLATMRENIGMPPLNENPFLNPNESKENSKSD